MDEEGPWDVLVDDNFHYMDEEERYHLASYPSYEAAVAACRRVVDACLVALFKPGMSAEDLWQHYRSFGEDPFVRGPQTSGPSFSAWAYAKERSLQLAGREPGGPEPGGPEGPG